MDSYNSYQGLTLSERQVLNCIFEELRLNHHSSPATEFKDKTNFELTKPSEKTSKISFGK